MSVEPPKTSLRCRGRRRAVADPCGAAGVVVGLSLLLAVVRRAAEDVVELRGRRRAVVAPPILPRAAVDVVVPQGSRQTVMGRFTRRNIRWED